MKFSLYLLKILVFVDYVRANFTPEKLKREHDSYLRNKNCSNNLIPLELCPNKSLYGNGYNEFNFKDTFSEYKSPANLINSQPVLQYVNPYYNTNYGNSTFSHRAGKEEKGQNEEHEQDKGHQEPQVHTHHGGWGWGHHHEIEHHKKKGKKSKLHKYLKKLQPHHKPIKMIWKLVPECDGWENFIKDLEIISLKLGWLGFKKATIAFIVHILNQAYIFVSLFIIGLPDRLATFVDLIAPGTTPSQIRDFIATVGLLDFLVSLKFSFPAGNFIIFTDFLAEVLTLASLVIASITIFEDIVEEKAWTIFGIDVRELFEGYGCNNPFSKEKKIKEFFDEVSSW